MIPIGGYLELELRKGNEYHHKAIRLNTGRNALEYVLRAKNYKKINLPYYTCDVLLEPVIKLGLEYEFYKIDQTFRPDFDFECLSQNDVFVFNNYFGICDKQVKELVEKNINLVIDNSQAFYSKPYSNIDTFYSPRKFFGVPDGAYLYTDKILNVEIEKDKSIDRFKHLLGRIDNGAENHYHDFKESDDKLKMQPIKFMSNLTQKLLDSIDYENAAKIRKQNFSYIHNYLKNDNLIEIIFDDNQVPLVYPFLNGNEAKLKTKLLENKIYVATYWNNVSSWVKTDSFEYFLLENLVAVPIDQRYNIDDMNRIINLIQN